MRQIYSMVLPPITRVCIGHGGIKGIIFASFIRALGPDITNTFTHWSGVSAGALISLLMVVGVSPDEIIKLGRQTNIMSEFLESGSFENIAYGGGLFLHDRMRERIVEQMALHGFSADTTFAELLERTGKHLALIASNKTRFGMIFMSPESTPSTKVVDGALMSMYLPFVFVEGVYGGQRVSDGALARPSPVQHPYYTHATAPESLVVRLRQLDIPQPPPVEGFWSWLQTWIIDGVPRLYRCTTACTADALDASYKELMSVELAERNFVYFTPRGVGTLNASDEQKDAMEEQGRAAGLALRAKLLPTSPPVALAESGDPQSHGNQSHANWDI